MKPTFLPVALSIIALYYLVLYSTCIVGQPVCSLTTNAVNTKAKKEKFSRRERSDNRDKYSLDLRLSGKLASIH